MYVLEDIVTGARSHLTANGCSTSTICHYETVWRRLCRWCAANAPDGYDGSVERRYLEEAGLASPQLTKQQRFVKRAVERLIEVAAAGAPAKPTPARKYLVPTGMMPAYGLYEAELARRGLRSETIASYLSAVRHFLSACGASRPEDLSPMSVTAFSRTMSGYSPQTRAAQLYVARDFARTLAGKGLCDPSVAASMPMIPGHKHSSVPAAYTAGEVSALLEGRTTGRCPLRTRAIMLLAAVLGMRAGDIRALRTTDVDWRAKTLTFVQSKTKVAQVLPMPDEVWLALADYLKNERPDVGDDRIFVTSFAPYHPIDTQESFHRSVTRAFSEAGVDVSGRRHGLHSLRHSAATNMLSDGTPHPTISAVLGHSSTNVTRRYLSKDVESLRGIALEVPTCP